MHVSSLLVALGSLHAATPQQNLQEELRAHPWRFSPGSVRSTPTPTQATPSPAPEAVVPTPAVATPSAPAAVQAKPSVPASTAGAWSIQLASLSSEDGALKRKIELEATLGANTVSIVPAAGAWKLRTGSYPDKKSAQKARDEIKKKGLDGFPVEP